MTCKILIFYLVALIFCRFQINDSANILIVMPLPAHSHFKSFQPLWEELIKRGHNLTIIAGFRLSENFQPNYTLVDMRPTFTEIKVVFAELRRQTRIQNLIFTHDSAQTYSEVILKLPEIQNLINSNCEFDLVVVEMFFFDAFFAFGYKFNAPVIAASPQTLIPYYNWILGNPFPSSYCPHSYLPLTEKMSFLDRVINTVFNFLTVLYYEFVSLPRSQTLIEKYFHFDKENTPHIKNIMKNISVTFENSHYSFGYIKPQLPNVVHTAGLHLTPLKILPSNIQEFMDEAEHGVIYVSLGSLIEPSKMEDLGKIFISVFEKIPEKVIMKWDAKLLPHIPSDILVQKWIPQVEVLNHPNCRLFITHGGIHSLLESVNASVPLIGIPFYSDQKYNIAIVEYYEIGAALQSENNADELSSKIDDVLHNPKYKENIKKRSQIFRERLTSPLETAVHWVEHVIQHKGTAHLKSFSSQLYWYELYSLDVLAILAVFILVLMKMLKFIFGKISYHLVSVKVKVLGNSTSLRNEKLINNLKID